MTSLKKHPDYLTEIKRLESTKKYIDSYIRIMEEKQQACNSEIRQAFVDLDYLDSSQSYITILVNARYLDSSRASLEKVLRAKAKPYFSRIDFQDNREKQPTKYYIGKLSLFKDNHEPLIIDWRSPIASVYYDGRLGDVSYEAEEGRVRGELLLKRQYTVEDGELCDFFDVEITTNDQLLQSTLRGNADHRLRDIVATIQAEQNKIIRAKLDKPLIVQGVAGSGKTTIALHRIAYLIYTYEKTFKPENFMIIAPNKLFLNYISDVLPELGVEQTRQTTFAEFCLELLSIKCKLVRQEEKLIALLNAKIKSEKQAELIEWAAAFKGSMAFRQLIDNYLVTIERGMLPQEDVLLDVYPIMTAQEVEEAFICECGYLPLYKRLEQIKKKLSFRTKQRKKEIIDSIVNDYEHKIEHIRSVVDDEDEARQKAVDLMYERDEIIARVEKSARTLSANYIKKFKKRDTLSYYRQLITDPDALLLYSPEPLDTEYVRYLCETSEARFREKKLEQEDLAALLHLKYKLEGFAEKITCSYVVIDEAQDFSLFQFYVLKQVLGTQNFTLLGDLAQGIHAYRGVKNWQDVNQQIFSGEATSLTLRQSYRTTVEIMELANHVLQKGLGDNIVLAEPVVRHGSKPEVVTYTKTNELATETVRKVKALSQNGYSSVAVIGKTLTECKKIKSLFEKHGLSEVPVLTGDEDDYNAGVMIVPSYASKGLEFDAVLIVNLEDQYSNNELDAKLLYVAMTRAMHRLFVYSMKDTVAFI